MKTKKLFQGLAIVLGCVLIASCQKNELSYSCDPEIDNFVKDNIEDIKLLTRADIVELEPEMSRACFRAFSQEQRLNLWKEKLTETLLLDWNEKESAHLNSLIAFISDDPKIFSDEALENETLMDKLDIYMYKWKEYAENELKWSKKLVYSIAASPYSLANKEGDLQISQSANNTVKTIVEPPRCNCNYKQDECSIGPCSPGNCQIKQTGCGFLNMRTCDGTCINPG